MNTVLTIVVTILIFGALIALHELGHYTVARLFGVGIREYSIGMGPKLYQRKGKYNKFSIRALPIGGYVDMVGESSDDDGSDPEDAGKVPLNTKPIWQRVLIVLAGPFTNIVLGLVIMAVVVLCQSEIYGTEIDYFGRTAVSDKNMVYLTEDYPARSEDSLTEGSLTEGSLTESGKAAGGTAKGGTAKGSTSKGGFEKYDIIYAADGRLVNAADGLDAFLRRNGKARQFLVIRKNSAELVTPALYESVDFSKLKLAFDGGYLILSEDAKNADGAAMLQKNDIVYSVGGVLCAPEADGGAALRQDTAKDVLMLRRHGTKADPSPYIVEISDLEKAPLAVSGALMAGDEILKVGSYKARVFTDMNYGIFNDGVKPVDIRVKRDGRRLTVENVVFFKGSEKGVVYGDRDFAPVQLKKTAGTVGYNVIFQPVSTLKMTLDSLVQTFSGRYGMEALSGPVGIGGQIGEALADKSGGAERIFILIVMITLSLGVCNLLPLPVLDGGRILLYAIEAVRRKPLNRKVEQAIMTVSMILVLALMAFVMFKDIVGLL